MLVFTRFATTAVSHLGSCCVRQKDYSTICWQNGVGGAACNKEDRHRRLKIIPCSTREDPGDVKSSLPLVSHAADIRQCSYRSSQIAVVSLVILSRQSEKALLIENFLIGG